MAPTTVSLSHHIQHIAHDIVVAGMRGGHHFDVVFRGGHKHQATQRLIPFLEQVLAAMNTIQPTNGQDVFTQVTFLGTWVQGTFSLHDQPIAERLRFLVTGWVFQDLEGAEIREGDFAPALVH